MSIMENSSVLLYNVAMQPLRYISVKDAICKMVRQVAVVHDYDDILISPSGFVIELPTSIRLVRMTHYDRKLSVLDYDTAPWTKKNVMLRDRYKCAYCGKSASTVEHIIPQSQGGLNTWENTVACCFKCNNKRGDKSLKEAGMKLQTVPKVLTNRELRYLKYPKFVDLEHQVELLSA